MPLIDSNIVIYSGDPSYAPLLLPYIIDPVNLISVITIIETLGYHRITPSQTAYFESIFKVLKIVPIDDAVIQK
jgi:hypothetical protein